MTEVLASQTITPHLTDSGELVYMRKNSTLTIPTRKSHVEHVAFHLGPTNSGKTYRAIEDLCQRFTENPSGRYVYAAPLRMLAYEIYGKMVERFGEDAVGFITGEEDINTNAPIIAATVEMAPREGDLLIVDEAHWIADEERGHRWTEILTTAEYHRIHVVTAAEAYPVLSELVKDAGSLDIHTYERRTPIEYTGSVTLDDIPANSAVICFTRQDVYDVALELRQQGQRVCLLYGALPAEVRKAQIAAFERGEYDVMVTTNVIGHGINLTLDSVVFAGTTRFDGTDIITIPSWEAGQIAGRAGRFGLSERGTVMVLRDSNVDGRTVRLGVKVAAGARKSDLDIDRPIIKPSFSDLGIGEGDCEHLLEAMHRWTSMVEEDGRFTPSPMDATVRNIMSVSRALNRVMNTSSGVEGEKPWYLPASQLWNLVDGPFTNRDELLTSAVLFLESGNANSDILASHFEFSCLAVCESKNVGLKSAESAFQQVAGFKMLMVMLGEEGRLGSLMLNDILKAERRLSDMIASMLKGWRNG